VEDKYAAERKFWAEEFDRYLIWYEGRIPEFYGVPAPHPKARITRYGDMRLNALETWINADRWRYCKHLFIEPTYFNGKNVLEIGPGPLGLARWFVGAALQGIEPLVDFYASVGYPVFDQPISYSRDRIEDSIIPTGSMDTIISVNAIDHVDDFEAAARQIQRILRPGGEIRLETHYHEATTTEPCVLTDERVRAAFDQVPLKKLAESPSSLFYPRGTHPESDRFVVWSNKDYLYTGWAY